MTDFLELSSIQDSETGGEIRHESDQLPDFHLRSPLHPLRGLADQSSNGTKRFKTSKSILRSIRSVLTEGSPSLLKDILDNPPEESLRSAGECLSDMGVRIRKDSTLNFPMPVHLMCSALDSLSDNFPIEYWNRMRFSEKILLTMNAISSRRPPPGYFVLLKENCFKTAAGGYYIYITPAMIGAELITPSHEERPYIICFDADWLRMVSDLHTERFLIYIGCTFGRTMNPLHYPPWETIYDIINWGDNVLKEYGNQGFKLLKAYEALCIGYLQSTCESTVVNSSQFLENTISDLLMENISFQDHIDSLLRTLGKTTSPHHITQLYGLHRIWGHPVVDNEKGMEKVKLIGRKDIARSDVVAKEAGRSFMIMFCREYRKKNGVYPQIVPGQTQLHHLIAMNSADALDSRLCDLSEWDEIQFMPCFEIPETFNLSMVVADKAISLTRSELIKNIRLKKTVMNQKKRRGVLRWIDDQAVRPREFLQQINDGDFPEDHKIIGLTPKERELNPTPRMFALMSHLMRIYVVVTEQLLSDHILQFFPQITMTDSLLDLTKKLYTTVRPQASEKQGRKKRANWASKTICISLDFEKWNGHMRHDSTFYVFRSLGELFGMSHLYNRTYEIFEESYIYLADGSYIPKVRNGELQIEEPFAFTGHRGGMEGLRQKGWTIFTVCCLNMVCSKYNCTYKIMGMGDNQVLQITLYTYKIDHRGNPTEEGCQEMKGVLDELFADLVYTFRQLGLPLKPLETWMSEDLYLYGKYPLLRGVPLSMDLKKIMRMFHNSNDDIMTMENGMGTVYGNAASATQLSCCSVVAYLIGMFMASYCASSFLEYHPLLGHGLMKEISGQCSWSLYMPGERAQSFEVGGKDFSTQCLRLLLQTVPRTLGGYNSLNIFEIIMRGFPDNLSRDLTYVYQITSSTDKDMLDTALMNWIHPIYMPTKNFKLLIEDVTSVNLLVPRSPASGIRQAVEKYISKGRTIKNMEFRDLMHSKIKNQADRLAEKLCSGSDLHIRLLHDIYSSTIIGYVDGIISKVTKASTIQRLAVDADNRDIMRTVAADEINFFRYFVWRSSVRSDLSIDECPSMMAQKMRREGWGKILRGVSTPFPMAYLSPTSCDETSICGCTDGYISVHFPDKQETNSSWNLSLGSNAPYLGSITKEKVITGLGSKVYSSEPLVRRPLNLLRAINWFVPPQSVTAMVIRSLTHAVTDVKTGKFEGLTEGTAGAEVHRYRDMSLKHGALASSNYLYTTRMHISTDNFTRYSKGGDNYDVHFQACLCSITEWCNTSLLSWFYHGDSVPKFKHFKQTCQRCVSRVDESFCDLDDPLTPHYIPSRKNNPYLFVPQDALVQVHKMKPWFELSLTYMRSEDYVNLTNSQKMRWATDLIADMVFMDIVTAKGEETAFSVCLTDVKAYERTVFLKLNPEKTFLAVLERLRTHAEILAGNTVPGFISSKKHQKNKIASILYECPASTFLGLGMFYSWEETFNRMADMTYMSMPNTFPMTIDSMCSAARTTLLCLLDRNVPSQKRGFYVIPHDLVNSLRIHKMVAYESVRDSFNCDECNKEISSTDHSQFGGALPILECAKGHNVLDRVKHKCRMSHVTMERLRKDIEYIHEERQLRKTDGTLVPMTKNEVKVLIDLSETRQSLIAYSSDMPYPQGLLSFSPVRGSVSVSSLTKVISLPTSTSYKYLEILSKYTSNIVGRVMIVGDGLGQTSELVATYCNVSRITISTLADTGLAAPQTYPHAVQPTRRMKSVEMDAKTMLSKHNDILSDDYLRDWGDIFKIHDVLISDIEIMGEELWKERDEAMEKLVSNNDWKFFLIKDYLYTLKEFTRRSSFLIPKCGRGLRIITNNMRSMQAPEVWWVGGPTESCYKVRRCYEPRSLKNEWNNIIRSLMFDREYQDKSILDDLHNRIVDIYSLSQMYGSVLDWSSISGLGRTLPSNGNYTDLFYSLQHYKHPEKVIRENVDSKKKLHMSDYLKLREVLFSFFVAMLADVQQRKTALESSFRWALNLEHNKTKTMWSPYLHFSDGRTKFPMIDAIDCVLYPCMYVIENQLLVRRFKTSVIFRHAGGKRDVVFFPILGMAHRLFSSKSTSEKNGKTKA
uniref:Replicase n=1 Tax=Cnidium virus 2 TaxID=3057102 RepID=A0AA96T1V6_9RHAB|nr:MAG: RNA-dependent RNA polymerase [Cnidium virus 2]